MSGQNLFRRGGKSRGLQIAPQRSRHSLDRLAWDSLRLLLALSESGSFRSAASAAGVALNTIRTKIDRLEVQFGTPLIVRSVEGVRLTQEGHELVAIARQMQSLGQSTRRVQHPAADRMENRVRVSVTEGLGTFWLVPRFVDFHAANPEIGIDLHCDMTAPNVLFRDTDICIQLHRPTTPGLIGERVASLHVMPFATDAYIKRRGMPSSLADAADHELVWQEADQVSTEALSSYIASAEARPTIVLTTNTSSAHYWAVASGAGVGFLPTYTRAMDPAPVPINIGVNFRRDIYLVYHPGHANVPAVSRVLDALRSAFDGDRFPWFAETFVHPDDFKASMRAEDVRLFEGVRDR